MERKVQYTVELLNNSFNFEPILAQHENGTIVYLGTDTSGIAIFDLFVNSNIYLTVVTYWETFCNSITFAIFIVKGYLFWQVVKSQPILATQLQSIAKKVRTHNRTKIASNCSLILQARPKITTAVLWRAISDNHSIQTRRPCLVFLHCITYRWK